MGLIILVSIVVFLTKSNGSSDKVATVNGVSISKQEFNKQYKMILSYYETIARKLSDKEKKGLQEEVLARLVDKAIILQEAQKRNIVVTDEEVNKYISQKFKGNKKLQDEYLKERSLTLKDYKEVVRYQKTREKLYDIVTKNYKYEDKPIQFTKYLNELKKKAEIEVYVKFE